MEAIRSIIRERFNSQSSVVTFNELVNHDHLCVHWKVKLSDIRLKISPEICFQFSKFKLVLLSSVDGMKIGVKNGFMLEGNYKFETCILDQNGIKRHQNVRSQLFSRGMTEQNLISKVYIPLDFKIRCLVKTFVVWSMDYGTFHSEMGRLVNGDVLTIVFCVSVGDCCCHKHRTVCSDPEQSDSSLERVSREIGRLFNNEEFSDVTLVCGEHTIPAHKNILSARSDVFAAMFRNQMTEGRDGIVEIPDLQLPILNSLLRYIYSGIMDDVFGDAAIQLYRAADKYVIHTLKRKCASIIFNEMTENNICNVLFLAHLHNDDVLKKCVIEFIQKERKIFQSEQWNDFSKRNPNLAVEVYDAFVQRLQLE